MRSHVYRGIDRDVDAALRESVGRGYQAGGGVWHIQGAGGSCVGKGEGGRGKCVECQHGVGER